MNSDGVFELSAHMGDGTDLEPTILKGGKVQRVAEKLEKLLPQLASAKNKNPDDAKEIERKVEEVLGKIRGADDVESTGVDIGEEVIDILEGELGKAGVDKVEIEQKAENIINFAQYVIHTFEWALDPNLAYDINEACEALRDAVKGGTVTTIEQRIEGLDKVLKRLPDVINLLLGIRGRIEGTLRSTRPAEADAFIRDLDEVEKAFRSRDPLAMQRLATLAQKVAAAISQAGAPLNSGCICPTCKFQNPAGSVRCVKCGDNLTIRT